MKFSEKLKQAMQELGLNQAQVVGMTGKSKASVSYYLSGKQTPTEQAQCDMAIALGLDPDYFIQPDEPIIKLIKQGNCVIPEIRTLDAGKLMRMSHVTIEKGLIQGVFPWGYAIQTSKNHHRYFINARRFAEIEGIEIPPEMVL